MPRSKRDNYKRELSRGEGNLKTCFMHVERVYSEFNTRVEEYEDILQAGDSNIPLSRLRPFWRKKAKLSLMMNMLAIGSELLGEIEGDI